MTKCKLDKILNVNKLNLIKMKCNTCEDILFWKQQERKDFKQKIFAKLSIYSWKKGVRAIKGREKSNITTKTYALNYCPTCGRKIKDLKWNAKDNIKDGLAEK